MAWKQLMNITGPEGPEGPRGLPGVNAVDNDEAVATYVQALDSETAQALDARITDRMQEIIGRPGGMGQFANWAALYEADDLMLGLLSSWGDVTGNGNDLIIETPTASTVEEWLNGEKAVKFAASPMVKATISAIPQPFSIAFVGHSHTYPGWFFGDTNVRVSRASAAQTPPGEYRVSGAGGTIFSGVDDDEAHLFICIFDGNNSRLIMGNHDVMANVGSNTLGSVRLGGWQTSAHYLTGHIAALGIVPGVLTSQQIADLRDWADLKYGVL